MKTGNSNSDNSTRVEAYLDRILIPLTRRLTPFHQQELRRELRMHLWERVTAYQELGMTETESVTEALRQFGGAEDFLRQWHQEWTKITPLMTLHEVGAATRTALLLSLPALLVTCLGSPIWLHVIYQTQLAWAPEWMRFCGLTGVISGWAGFGIDLILLPLIVGTAVGRLAPRHAGLGMLVALTLEIILTDWFLWPDVLNLLGWFAGRVTEQIFICSILWLPLACAAAAVSGRWTQHRDKRRVIA